jgi:3-methylcrotonyl-CoA carboxylase alpha subunit
MAQTLLAEAGAGVSDPFSRRDGWRPFVPCQRPPGDEPLRANLTYLHDGAALAVGGDAPALLRFVA